MLSEINAGDTAWILLSAVLVFLMIPGFALFYSGLSRNKNTLTILTQSITLLALVSIQWALFGYSLSFGPDHNGWIGTLAWAGLRSVGTDPNLEYAGTVPHQAFMIYQAMVAAIAPAILLNALATRIKFSSLCVFVFLWTSLVYDPIAHWIWGTSGFLRNAGAIDFAGGTVIHVSAAIAVLAAVLATKRTEVVQPPPAASSPNLLTAALGGCLLWVGWFGLTAGHALAAGASAVSAFVETYFAATAGALVWVLLDSSLRKKPTLPSVLLGALAGLIAITPAASFVSVFGAIGIGVTASFLSYTALAFMEGKFGLGAIFLVIALHGVAGVWGMLATGLLADKSVFLIQVKTMLAPALYAFGMSYALVKIVDYLIGTEL